MRNGLDPERPEIAEVAQPLAIKFGLEDGCGLHVSS
jgi:hypothetical protein